MADIDHYDILILGGGKAGKTLAMDRARAGQRVALVEQGMIGGSCINVACIPSKALIRSAEIADLVTRSGPFGIDVQSSSVGMARVAERTAEVVRGMVATNRHAFDESGLELVLGWGMFVEPRIVEVRSDSGTRRLSGDRIYLNLGTRAAIPDIAGLAAAKPMTHVEALLLSERPSRLVIIGGGYIGMEMAQAFRRLGSEVALLEVGRQIAAREDDDVSGALMTLLTDQGVEIATGMTGLAVSGTSGDTVSVEAGDGRVFSGSHLLVATGRRPMTADIGLHIAGVALDASGFIIVDDRLATTASAIWALGEAAGTPMFTHASLDDYRVAKSQIVGKGRSTTDRLIPYCVFVDPEFARVGLIEADAERAAIPYRLAKIPMDAVPRARTMSATTGFMKCLIAQEDDRILGFALLGERAGEVMTIVQTAMLANLPFTTLRDAIIAHPTIAEGLNVLFAAIKPAD